MPDPREPFVKAGMIVSDVVELADGSGFFTATYPLPDDHWVFGHENNDEPPAPFRDYTNTSRHQFAEKLRLAARYAIRAATGHGRDSDFDPDAMVSYFVTGALGRDL
jgi:hypothetical protein